MRKISEFLFSTVGVIFFRFSKTIFYKKFHDRVTSKMNLTSGGIASHGHTDNNLVLICILLVWVCTLSGGRPKRGGWGGQWGIE